MGGRLLGASRSDPRGNCAQLCDHPWRGAPGLLHAPAAQLAPAGQRGRAETGLAFALQDFEHLAQEQLQGLRPLGAADVVCCGRCGCCAVGHVVGSQGVVLMSATFSVGIAPGYVESEPQADIAAGMDVLDAAYLIAQTSQGGIKALAVRMGINAGTLQHKLNTNNDTHHLTLRESVRLQVVTGNAAVLHAMASELGYECRRTLPDQAEGDPVEAFMHFQSAVAEVTRAAADAHRQPSRNAVRRLDRQVQELTVMAQYLARSAQQRLAATPGGGNAY